MFFKEMLYFYSSLYSYNVLFSQFSKYKQSILIKLLFCSHRRLKKQNHLKIEI